MDEGGTNATAVIDVDQTGPADGASVAEVERWWRREFEGVAGQHAELTVGDIGLTAPVADAVGPSLATFQLGESGSGDHLLAAARGAGVGDDQIEALRAFVVEEQEHARLLGLILDAMGTPRLTAHWTDHVFVLIRRIKSLRTEVLTLLVAEVIALRYYSALRDGLPPSDLTEVCGRIHADELRHVEFHAATLPRHLRRFPPGIRHVVRLAWNALVTATSVLIAVDHGPALAAAGMGRRRFVRDVWHLRADLDRRLFG
ncbi:MAG: ferritin-like domain-containing protein [Actinomycetota bacterium]